MELTIDIIRDQQAEILRIACWQAGSVLLIGILLLVAIIAVRRKARM